MKIKKKPAKGTDSDEEDDTFEEVVAQSEKSKKKKKRKSIDDLEGTGKIEDAGDLNDTNMKKKKLKEVSADETKEVHEGETPDKSDRKKKKKKKKKKNLQEHQPETTEEGFETGKDKEKKRRRSEDSTTSKQETPLSASKKAKKNKDHSAAKAKAGAATPPAPPRDDDTTDGIPSFPAEEADHAETPAEAYQHLAPVLSFVASHLGIAPGKLRIYDPYYCAGSVKKHLASAGFADVYNRNEDFYKAQTDNRIPPHDVVVTNPPYSGEHVQRFLRFAARNGKPWFLLVPNYVYMKDFYAAATARSKPMYLTPPTRYIYQSPKGVCNALGLKRKSGEHKTAPFQTFWFMGLEPAVPGKAVLQWWLSDNMSSKTKCKLCKDASVLPHDMRDSFDPLRKRPPKHQRKAMKKTHTADGRRLCRECGQVHGNCKHTKNVP